MIWDTTVKRQIGIMFLGLFAVFGFVLFEILDIIGLSDMWQIFVGFAWYSLDTFMGFYMYHVYKVTKADLPPKIPIPESYTEIEIGPVKDEEEVEIHE